MTTDYQDEVMARLRAVEEKTEKTYRMIRSAMMWRSAYWVFLTLIVISGYIYLGPVLDGLFQKIKLLLNVVGS